MHRHLDLFDWEATGRLSRDLQYKDGIKTYTDIQEQMIKISILTEIPWQTPGFIRQLWPSALSWASSSFDEHNQSGYEDGLPHFSRNKRHMQVNDKGPPVINVMQKSNNTNKTLSLTLQNRYLRRTPIGKSCSWDQGVVPSVYTDYAQCDRFWDWNQ